MQIAPTWLKLPLSCLFLIVWLFDAVSLCTGFSTWCLWLCVCKLCCLQEFFWVCHVLSSQTLYHLYLKAHVFPDFSGCFHSLFLPAIWIGSGALPRPLHTEEAQTMLVRVSEACHGLSGFLSLCLPPPLLPRKKHFSSTPLDFCKTSGPDSNFQWFGEGASPDTW